ncbi:MAG: hypothetical protein ACU84H_16725 [Gammaproteobacteria bacterium]
MKSTIPKSMPPLSHRCLGVAAIAIGGLLAWGQAAFAGVPPPPPNCMQDVWNAHGNTQNLQCTANDVRLSSVDNITADEAGTMPITSCISGAELTFWADFTMPLTAQARYDLGLFIKKEGDTTALTGQCNAYVVTDDNSLTFVNLDPSPPDFCGDIDDAHNPQVIRQQATVTCQDQDNNDFLDIPWCTSWRQPGANEVCDTVVFDPFSPSSWDAFPGSPSKCNCGLINVDVTIEEPTGTLTKTATEAVVTYHIVLTNDGSTEPLTVETLCDDKVGDISGNGGSNPACVGGVPANLVSTDCPDLPHMIAAGDDLTCDIEVKVPSADAAHTNHLAAEVSTAGGDDTFTALETIIVDLDVMDP